MISSFQLSRVIKWIEFLTFLSAESSVLLSYNLLVWVRDEMIHGTEIVSRFSEKTLVKFSETNHGISNLMLWVQSAKRFTPATKRKTKTSEEFELFSRRLKEAIRNRCSHASWYFSTKNHNTNMLKGLSGSDVIWFWINWKYITVSYPKFMQSLKRFTISTPFWSFMCRVGVRNSGVSVWVTENLGLP